MAVSVKICGINDIDAMEAAVDGGADLVGLVFFPPSPRAVTVEEAADLTELVPEGVLKVGLFVDADDRLLDGVLTQVRLDLLQFHGTESPERVEAVRLEYGLPVMKALGVSAAADLAAADAFAEVADRLLFDAKAPPGALLPGGNAASFDWRLLAGRRWPLPWMLAGGLDAGNLAEAVRLSGARAVDVSSGVEEAPGRKSPDKIRAFLEAARRL